ncbi:MAG: YSC84-related protein [Candidatus Rifleibacteriota bacterium]
MRKISFLILFAVCFCLVLSSASAGWNPFRRNYKRSGEENVQLLIKKIKKIDPDIKKIFENAVGWAVFPEIGKAGVGIGGASGNGRVYRKGEFIGTTTMTQISVGFQLGGQIYSEIIFFQDDNTLNKFKDGKFELGANVSAVIVDEGVAKTLGFKDGTIVLVMPKKGLMYEATVSGQKFTFQAKSKE